MTVLRITQSQPTPEERKGLEDREQRRDYAELHLATAQNTLRLAHGEVARARKAYRKALNDLVTYRERTGQ